MNTEFTIIKSQHEKTMLDMEKMMQSISDTTEKYKEFIEDKDSYSIRHTHLLKECNQLKKIVRMLLNENRKLLVEQADQEASFGEEKSSVMRPARTYIPSAKQQQPCTDMLSTMGMWPLFQDLSMQESLKFHPNTASTRQARERVLCEGPAAEDRHRSGTSRRSLIPGPLESEDQWMESHDNPVSAGRTSSQNCNITNHMKNMNKLDDMKFYIRKINAELEELFRILDIDMNTDLNYRMNTEFTIIKSQHEKTMLDMEKMKQSISDSIDKYKEFIEDNDSYSIRHTHLLKECNQLKEKVRMLLNENRKLLVEQADQEASFGEEKSSVMRPARTYIPSAKQQQL